MSSKHNVNSEHKIQFSAALLNPKCWPTWLGIFLLWLSSKLPYGLMLIIGNTLGELAYWTVPSRRRIAAKNIEICFPELSAAEQKQLTKKHFHSLAIGILEMTLAWWGNPKRIAKLAHYNGLENLLEAQKQGGVILLSAHFTTLEIAGRCLTLKAPAAGMFRPHKNAVVAWAMQYYRDKMAQKAIMRDDVRGMLRTLKQGDTVWYAADQSKNFKYTTVANFFGEPCVTNTSTSRFAKMSKAQVVPFFMYRDQSGYQLDILPPLDNFPSGDETTDAQRMNDLIEVAVRKAPEQYLWTHKRFKGNRGKPNPYLK